MIKLSQIIIYTSMLITSLISASLYAENTSITITVLQPQVSLSYPKETRLSQVLTDAYSQVDYDVYTLGSALIDPEKQEQIDARKNQILNQLKTINSPRSMNIARQLESIRFTYTENIEMDPSKVRVNPKLDPLISGNYWLSLPKRPQSINIITPLSGRIFKLTISPNSNLKDYLDRIPNGLSFNSAWIIQANKDSYLATDIQWKDNLYFLSPGATVFIGIEDLPKQYRNLNTDIAHLLAFQLEL